MQRAPCWLGITCCAWAGLSVEGNVTPRQVSDSQVYNHMSEYDTLPAFMSEMVTMISDAANGYHTGPSTGSVYIVHTL